MMSKVYDVARYIIFAYETQSGSRYDNSELKLQKLMYLCQREALLLTGEPLFDNQFEGWKHGPVLPELRHFFDENYVPIANSNDLNLTDVEMYVVNNVVAQYGMYEAWYLANLTHDEESWKKSREGLGDGEGGSRKLNIEDIREDAANLRPYDYIFDMYVDEFEDFDGDLINE